MSKRKETQKKVADFFSVKRNVGADDGNENIESDYSSSSSRSQPSKTYNHKFLFDLFCLILNFILKAHAPLKIFNMVNLHLHRLRHRTHRPVIILLLVLSYK